MKLWTAFPATELEHTKTLLGKGQGCAAQADLQFSVLSALHVAGTKDTRWAPKMLIILTHNEALTLLVIRNLRMHHKMFEMEMSS